MSTSKVWSNFYSDWLSRTLTLSPVKAFQLEHVFVNDHRSGGNHKRGVTYALQWYQYIYIYIYFFFLGGGMGAGSFCPLNTLDRNLIRYTCVQYGRNIRTGLFPANPIPPLSRPSPTHRASYCLLPKLFSVKCRIYTLMEGKKNKSKSVTMHRKCSYRVP